MELCFRLANNPLETFTLLFCIMALSTTLQLTDNFNKSIEFANAYIKVNEITGNKDFLLVTYSIYESKTGNQLKESRDTFSLDLDGPNPIKQAYLHLKTLPEFSDAVDC